MSEIDPFQTQQHPRVLPFPAELSAEGFDEAQEIGRGGFGIVYRCVQPSLDRTVAVKVLTADLDEENLQRFLREQRAMGRLSGHPNIATILQVGTTASGHPYLVMQYHSRGSLDSSIRRDGPLDWATVLQLGIRVCGALEVAHRNGILHRDVKPANILLTDYGEPQLTDFGIARISGGFETTVGAVTGSPAFTAPEVLRGDTPEPCADVYSVGATLFCALTGHAAYERRSGERVVAQFLRITSEPVPDLRGEGIPDSLCSAIERAMAPAARDRPATAAAFGEEIREVQRLAGTTIDAMPLPGIAGALPPRSAHVTPGVAHPTPTAASTPPPTPATKFRPPETARSLVMRGRLLDLLRSGGRRRLIMIHAPTGYGKSILAAQWRQVLTDEGTAVAWLTADPDDDNVGWFLAHLVEAIERVRPDVTGHLRQALEEQGSDAQRYVLTMLIDRIHESGRRIVIVLDDWHRVGSPDTIAAVSTLLDEGCDHLQLLVTSRARAGLPLSRMRMRDELVDIDSEALRFDSYESRSFLVDVGGLDLTGNEVDALTQTTDGWVAGLQLASLSLRGRTDSADLIEQLTGRTQAIGEFLADNVLDTLDPSVLEFLMLTSICERVCGSLAVALTGNPHGQAMLEQVEAQDLFLRRTDENSRWFRYHHLFAQFLQHRLERDRPDKPAELHRLASQWFAEHHLLNDAVDHALAGGDAERAVELVEDHGMELLEHARMSTVLGLIEKLPSRSVLASVRLQLILAWSNTELLRIPPARAALDRIDTLLRIGRIPASDVDAVRAEVGVIEADVLLFADRVDGIAEAVAETFARPDDLRPWVVSAGAGIATFAAVYSFDFAKARDIERWAAPYHDRAGGPYSPMWGQCIMGIAANEQLDIVTAEAHIREGLRIGVDATGPHSYTARLASALLGDLLYERGDLDAADRLLQESHALGSAGGVDFLIGPYVIGARVSALTTGRSRALALLDEGDEIARTLDLPRLRARIDNERVRLHLHDSEYPVPTLRDMPPAPVGAGGIAQIVAEYDASTAIMVLLTDPTGADTGLACTQAAEQVRRLEHAGRARALLRANRLLVGCLTADGRPDEAQALLANLAAQCARHGLARYLVDDGPPIGEVVEALVARHRENRWEAGWPVVHGEFLGALQAALRPPEPPHLSAHR